MKFKVDMNVKTWVKDSHGLFDYQAAEEHYQSESHVISHDCVIHRDNQSKYLSSYRVVAKTHLTNEEQPEKGAKK